MKHQIIIAVKVNGGGGGRHILGWMDMLDMELGEINFNLL